jgi:hypothetical protein
MQAKEVLNDFKVGNYVLEDCKIKQVIPSFESMRQ